MISIVIATYNGERYIEKQLNSLRMQTLPADEVVIIDDCSTDNTATVVSNYIEAHRLESWNFSKNASNRGYKKNFYDGIKKVSGDIVFLCDQDDEWCLTKIQLMVSIMSDNPDILALNSGVSLIDGESRTIKTVNDRNYYNCNFLYSKEPIERITYFNFAYLIKHNISPGCTMAIRKEIQEAFLETYNSKLPHDWHLNMIAAAKNGCAFVNEVLIHYRRHNNNAIGINTGVVAGIQQKTRAIRIEDYSSRLDSARRIMDYYNVPMDENISEAIGLIKKMVKFYKKPSMVKLLEIRCTDGYFELAKKKVRIWEIVVAIHLDTIIATIFNDV